MTDDIHPQLRSMTINELRRTYDRSTGPEKRKAIAEEIKKLAKPDEKQTDDIVTRLRDPGFWTSDGKVMFEAADEITRLKARCEVLERVIHNVEAWHMVPDEDQKT